MTIPQTIQRLRELLEKATPGPWEVSSEAKSCHLLLGQNKPNHPYWKNIAQKAKPGEAGAQALRDFTFLKEARNSLPALLTALEQATVVLESAKLGFERIETADWSIEQARLGAKSDGYFVRKFLSKYCAEKEL